MLREDLRVALVVELAPRVGGALIRLRSRTRTQIAVGREIVAAGGERHHDRQQADAGADRTRHGVFSAGAALPSFDVSPPPAASARCAGTWAAANVGAAQPLAGGDGLW